MQGKLTLESGCWYGWQMMPGYGSEIYAPYFSPILVEGVTPRKTGKGILNLQFINARYAEGVQDFDLDLRVLKHETGYLVSEILYKGSATRDRTAIISHIDFDWMRRFCHDLWAEHPPSSFGTAEQSSVSRYITALHEL